MTEDELKSILAAHARDFADKIIELFRNASLEDLAALDDVSAGGAPASEPEEEELTAAVSDENEVSVLEHLNGAGKTGSTLNAWIISTHGELEADEHAHWEGVGQRALDGLVTRGLVSSKHGGPARGTVYTLLPAT